MIKLMISQGERGFGFDSEQWFAANHRYLMAAIAQVQSALVMQLQQQAGEAGADAGAVSEPVWEDEDSLPAIEALCQLMQLSSFERQILLLVAGVEINPGLAAACGEVMGNPQQSYPSFGLAMALFANPHWTALTPDGPLRRWKLLELGPGPALSAMPLRIDERILHFLLGIKLLDERLEGLAGPISAQTVSLPPSYERLAEQMAVLGLMPGGLAEGGSLQPVIQLCGGDSATKRAIAQAACEVAGLSLIELRAESFPTELSQFNLLRSLCEREALLQGSGFLLNCDAIPEGREGGSGEGGVAQLNSLLARLIDDCPVPLMVMSQGRRRQRDRALLTFETPLPTLAEQRHLWQAHLGEAAVADLNGHVDRLVSNFNLSPLEIQAACTKVNQSGALPDAPALPGRLWDACLSQARPRLDELAQQIKAKSEWADLVLPEAEMQVLKTLAAHVSQRAKVYEQWGFGDKSGRGLGISALFAGPSGTGKTLAAEVLAHALNLDLYRIDLSTVVSKYIGETEKNLRRIFDAAEAGGSVLLFDEADALFGKRSEVKDSHDRYANMEVAYLLQRIESYRGLAILTTNLKGSVDQAFLRRIRFIVQFPFPDVKQRSEIWRRVFPTQAPTERLAYNKLAKLSVAGGNIRNIAVNAAFLAADAGDAVQMQHILQASRAEYIKLERPLTDAEVKGWVKVEVVED